MALDAKKWEQLNNQINKFFKIMKSHVKTMVGGESNQKPSAFVTIGKNRQKLYGDEKDTIYLPNKSEFEIELFNPTQKKVLSCISLNGNVIGGIILKPGERVYLDRFIEENKKFLFDVYEVSGKSDVVKRAIEKNGLVEVEFYNEKEFSFYENLYYTPANIYDNSSGKYPLGYPHYPLTNICYPLTNIYYSSVDSVNYTSISNSVSTPKFGTTTSSKNIETGRVEKGGESKQNLTDVLFDRDSYCVSKLTYKILPISQKPMSVTEVNRGKKFCVKCGAKVGKTDKFCSACGIKL